MADVPPLETDRDLYLASNMALDFLCARLAGMSKVPIHIYDVIDKETLAHAVEERMRVMLTLFSILDDAQVLCEPGDEWLEPVFEAMGRRFPLDSTDEVPY